MSEEHRSGRAIVLREHGGPLRLQVEEVGDADIGPNDVLLRQTYSGVNFHDVLVRTGVYRTLPLPGTPGVEGVGVIERVGSSVVGLAPGDRVTYISRAYGSYASTRVLPASKAVRLPAAIDDKTAAAIFLRGLTVQMLVEQVHRVGPGDWMLVQAAAGGVGRMLARWGSSIGARVVGTVSSEAKAEVAKRAGCEEVIHYSSEDVLTRVLEITSGRGVDVAYDGVGQFSFNSSLDSLRLCGHLISFGQASGSVPAIELSRLHARSASLSRPSVFHFAESEDKLQHMSQRLFHAVEMGWVQPEDPFVLDLADAAHAHEMLESRKSTRPILLKI